VKVLARSDDRHMVPTKSVPMDNTMQHYAWGSHSLLAGLRGDSPTKDPEAELWFGAHPSASSTVRWPEHGGAVRLDETLAENPALLGASVYDEFGRLPFLLKLLAAAEPLSLQAHPNRERARQGFARENALGLSPTDPARCYKDDNHKPELICALTPFRALSGFREPAATADLLESLDVKLLAPVVSQLRHITDTSGAVGLVASLLTLDEQESLPIALATAAAVAADRDRQYAPELVVARRVAETNPGDIGIVIALMLELVTLQPGQAIYLGAGRLHAYIDGLGVEIMAASDNVLRGGLTPKHVDVHELVEVLDGHTEPIEVLEGTPVGDGEWLYPTPATEFALSRIDLVDDRIDRVAEGPEIVLVTAGQIDVDGAGTKPTASRFVPSGSRWRAEGTGQIFRARVGPQN